MIHTALGSQRARLALLAAGLAFVLVLPGCGGETGDLTGTVFYKDEPLNGGTVSIVTADSELPQLRQGEVGSDGRYEVKGIPVGEAIILVVGRDSLPDPTSVPPDKEAGPPARLRDHPSEAEGKAPTPPRKKQPVGHVYAKPATSPLKITITRGQMSHDIRVD